MVKWKGWCWGMVVVISRYYSSRLWKDWEKPWYPCHIFLYIPPFSSIPFQSLPRNSIFDSSHISLLSYPSFIVHTSHHTIWLVWNYYRKYPLTCFTETSIISDNCLYKPCYVIFWNLSPRGAHPFPLWKQSNNKSITANMHRTKFYAVGYNSTDSVCITLLI